MNLMPFVVSLIATLGVSGLCLLPQPNDDIFASFDKNLSLPEIYNKLDAQSLKIVSFDEEWRHVVVSNPKGDAPNRLKRAGANFVLKAKFAKFCSNTPSETRK
ncbi:hypothetical protein [Hirschia litorea]|uniref:Uncharacterized protein n=1 Tax=Hirschia litorea TaxID=1199156 RepID=A0ABW2ILY3_9PROT